MGRKGSTTLELILASVGYVLLIALFVALYDASRVRLEIEAQRHAMDVGIGMAAAHQVNLQALEIASALEEAWPSAPSVVLTGACGASFPEVGIEVLDNSLTSVGAQMSGHSGASTFGAGISVSEEICVGAGSMSLLEVGGELRKAAPGWPGSQRSELLDPILPGR